MRIAALAMLIGVAAIGATTSARADVITTYTFSDTTVDGGGVLLRVLPSRSDVV
jgi:hypothetical protein